MVMVVFDTVAYSNRWLFLILSGMDIREDSSATATQSWAKRGVT